VSAPKWADIYGIAPDLITPEMAQVEALMERHWLLFDRKERQIVGCHCGFEADNDSDCGWGDSVVRHLFEAALL
jgi:hypothetical protein